MRTNFAGMNGANDNGRLLAEAWVVLEMHFMSRPHLLDEARAKLAEVMRTLEAEGESNPHVLKDRACRQVQLMFGPAPSLGDERFQLPRLRLVS